MDPSQLKALVDLVQAPSGFDDDILKRCAMKDLVGFELVRSPATTGKPREDVVEIAIDLACNKLFAVRGGANGSKRTLHATHYDPSRAGFIALIKATGL